MQRFRIIGLCLVAVVALSAVLAAGASAFVREPPEVGRCVKQTGGKWKDGGCKTASKPGEEKFEWQPAFEPGNTYNETHPLKLAYTSASKPETVIQLETTGTGNPGKVKSVVKCTKEVSEGLVTGQKTSTAKNVIFTGCESSGLKCKSAKGGEVEGEIRVNELDGLLGIEKKGETKAKDKVANEFTPKGPEGTHFVDFACGGINVEVRGHVLNPVTANAMKLTATVKFVAKAGKQKPEHFLGGPNLILESKFSNIPGATFEQSGQTLTAIQKNEEKLEINTSE
jgi:hypothetical protein